MDLSIRYLVCLFLYYCESIQQKARKYEELDHDENDYDDYDDNQEKAKSRKCDEREVNTRYDIRTKSETENQMKNEE
jgi:hypothetical protein